VTSSFDASPLTTAITDALSVFDSKDADEAMRLRQLQVRLEFAAAAADDEINRLAVEGLQQTLDEAIADDTPEHRDWLLGALQENLAAYRIQLELSGAGA
jgi:hypothetical protein